MISDIETEGAHQALLNIKSVWLVSSIFYRFPVYNPCFCELF